MIRATETTTVTKEFRLEPVDLYYQGYQFYIRVHRHHSEAEIEHLVAGANRAVKINYLDDPRNVTLSGGVL